MAAAEALSGRNVWLAIGKQTGFNAPAAPLKFYEVTDIGGLLPEYSWKKSDRRVGTRFKPLGSKSGKKVPVNFTVEVNAENVGLLLALGFGSNTVAAAGAAYKHSFTLAENLPYFTLWASTDLVADTLADDTVHQVVNCKVVSMKLDGGVDDVLKLAVEAVGTERAAAYQTKAGISGTGTTGSPNITGIASVAGLAAGQSITGTNIPALTTILSVGAVSLVMSANASGTVSAFSVSVPTPSFPAARSLYMKAEEGQAKIELGASFGALAQFDEATEFHFALANGVAPDMRLDNTAAASSLREGDSELTGNMKVVYNRNSLTEIKAFQAGTARALRFTATSAELAATAQPFKLVLTADKARYSGAPPSWDADMISADAQFEIEKTASYPLVEIVNAESGTY